MSAQGLELISRRQAAVILGLPGEFQDQVAQNLRALNLEVLVSKPKTDDLDLDYLIFLYDESLAEEGRELISSTPGARSLVVAPVRAADSVHSLFPNSRHLFYGDCVGTSSLSAPELSRLLDSAGASQEILLPEDGLAEYSLTALGDIVAGVVRAAVSPAWPGEVVLANPNTYSLLSLSHLLVSFFRHKVSIRFSAVSHWEDFPYDWESILEGQAKLGVSVTTPPDENLRLLLSNRTPEPKPAPPASPAPLSPPAPTPAKPSAKSHLTPLPKRERPEVKFVPLVSRRSPFSFPTLRLSQKKASNPSRRIFLHGLLFAAILYLASLALASTVTALFARSVYRDLRRGDLPVAANLTLGKLSGAYLEANLVALHTLPGFSGLSPLSDAVVLLNAYNQGLTALDTAKGLQSSASALAQYVLADNSAVDVTSAISQSRLGAEAFYQELSLLDASLPAAAPNLLSKYSSEYSSLKSQLSSVRETLLTSKAVLAALPDLIGVGDRRKYGVLFQNNMELRATGGFIGSFAVMSFENGKLYDLQVYDVYSADGELKGHVEPPTPIKNVLGEANWYFRDSNFDPDFPTTARRAEWFLKKEMNLDLQGTVGVNLNTVAALLKATGPLEIPDYQETITSDNLYERAEAHSEVNFFPGSTQKKEFLSAVANALFAKLHTLSSPDTLKVGSSLAASLMSKDTTVSVINTATEHAFATLGWNGALRDLPCPVSAGCAKDFLMLVDSNFGINKANFYISRRLSENLTLSPGRPTTHVLTVNYANRATSSAWPAGAYKNYQRLYLPAGATVDSVEISGQTLSTGDYTVTSEHGKAIVAYVVNVPINSSVVVSVSYSTPAISTSDTTYTWYWQRQSGTDPADPLTVTLNYPLNFHPAVISPAAAASGQQLTFDLKNSGDRRITIQFSQ